MTVDRVGLLCPLVNDVALGVMGKADTADTVEFIDPHVSRYIADCL